MDITSSRQAWDCKYFRVEERSVELADGRQTTWFSVHRPKPDTVHILAIDSNGMVPLLRQYRIPVGNWVWELPAGVCDVDGEAMSDTANRELAEEAGYHAREVIHLFSGTVSPGLTDELYHSFLCLDLEQVGEGGGLHDERIEIELVPFVSLQDFILEKYQQGELVDSKILAHIALVWRVFGEVSAREPEASGGSLDNRSRIRDILGVVQKQMTTGDVKKTDTDA